MIQAIIDQVTLTYRLVLDKRVPLWMKALLALPLIYILSPIDLIPDFILGLGQLDDLGVLLAAMRLFETIVPEYIVQEYRAQIGTHTDSNTVEGYTVDKAEAEKPKRRG